MALTRKFLEALGVAEAAIGAIIDEHTATTTRLQDELRTAKGNADKLVTVQKELDDLKAADYEGKYNAEKKDHDALKASIASEKSKSAKEAALKAYFEGKNIKDGNLKIAMRGVNLDEIELDGEKIKDTKSLDELVEGDYKSLVTTGNGGKDSGAKPAKTKVVDSGAKAGANESGGNDGKVMSLRDALRAEYATE